MSNEEPKKDDKKLPVRSRAPIRIGGSTGVGMEGDVAGVSGFPLEISPDGLRLGGRPEKDLKDGEAVNVITTDPEGIGIVDRKYTLKRLPDGKLELSPMGDPMGPKEVRDSLAHSIAVANRKVIKEEAFIAVEEALKRKSIPMLQDLKEASDSGKKLHITSQRGCMYLSIGRRSTVL